MQSDRISDMATPSSRDLGRALCIVTGASKGYGRSLALQIAHLLLPRSVLLLVARSADMLQALQVDLVPIVEQAGLLVRCVPTDLGLKAGIDTTVRVAKESAAADTDHVLLINNAASLGDVSRFAISFCDPAEVDAYLSLNVSSALSLTAGVLQAFPQRPGLRRTVVNISSLCALEPFPSWVLYCAGKAARNMMFRVLAKEEPDVRVLNYSPGPMDTDMQAQAQSCSADPALKQSFSIMHSQGKLLSCHESGAKLIRLLLEDEFPSGAHLDYYDL
ncbi:Sepiapterin reductase-like [Scleropages formosus]|uniref:Sepiapterin reductase n=1 Tax=Scleropages formosus TaxID=113540 RepID=A0A0N8JYP9_SCLFO|nr:Sepiapterin reductase-like [Scleropages formosus]